MSYKNKLFEKKNIYYTRRTFMENSILKILDFSHFENSKDKHSVLMPGKLFLSDRDESNEHKFKSIQMKYPVQISAMSLSIICTGGMANIKINLVSICLFI